MAKKEIKLEKARDLPISLQGIEKILLYLNERDREASSIRNISENTKLSMRVVKNILIQLEKFNQIERVVEKNNILPKWRITKFGKKVIKEAQGIEKEIKFPSREDELIDNIRIPDDIEDLKEEIKVKQESIISELKNIQVKLSKTLGTVLNINNPMFEDLVSFIIKRVKYIKQRVSNLPLNPLAIYKIKKKGEKEKKITKEEEEFLFVEIYFFNSMILNEIKRIFDFNSKLSQFIEKEAISKGYSTAEDLREEIRILTSLIYQRESINIKSHVISEENLKKLSKNKINTGILEGLIEIPLTEDEQLDGIKDVVLKYIAIINKGEKYIDDYNTEIADNIPLYALYQLILDDKPNLIFTIKQLEQVINSLADDGYIPGLKIIQEDEDNYIKVVQLKVHDISKDDEILISNALKLENFTLTDMINATGWDSNKIYEILKRLTDLGILKYSKSYLHGERWYIVTEKKS